MIVTAWNNGNHSKSGAGYGIRLTAEDRDRFFIREWQYVIISFEGGEKQARVNIDKDSFWLSSCRELIHIEIGRWLINNNLGYWPRTRPPIFWLEPLPERNFFLSLLP
jgi:hypothetical protein